MKRKLALLAAALAAGCALTPEASRQLESAQAAYRQAAADPVTRQYAPQELNAAQRALHDAERMAGEHGDSELVEHDAYVAERRARAAQAAAGARKAAIDLATAREQRRNAELAAAQEEARQAEAARLQAEDRLRGIEQEKSAAAEFGAEVKRLETEHPEQVRAREADRGWVLTLGGAALFEQGTTLRDDAGRALDDLAGLLRKHPGREVAVDGFSDSASAPDAAERLSERRAEAVKFALVQRGVEAYRIDARGQGVSYDRRVEVVVK